MTTLTYEVNAVADDIYKSFRKKEIYRGFKYPNLNQIKDILTNYIFLLEKNEIPKFYSSKGSDVKKIVNKIQNRTRYSTEHIYFTLYELEEQAKSGNLVAQKILNFDLVKSNGSKIFLPKIEPPKSFLVDVKTILLYALLILALIYFGPLITNIFRRSENKG